ncbi:DUF503 domain-containing protein [Candidatus Bipolaricaulota bacterium]|nr:DUF503 domain-containing protein [Candidatus Bipolaricaulota bacterium]
MSIGVLKVKFIIPGASSLKEKRSILQPFIHRIRNNYNISINELDGENDPGTATLGFAHIAKSSDLNHKKMAQIADEAAKVKNLQIERQSTEVI